MPGINIKLALALLMALRVMGSAAARGDESTSPRDVQALLRAGEYRRAIEALDARPGPAPPQNLTSFFRGYAHYHLKEFAEGLRHLRRSEAQGEPNVPLRSFLRGVCALETNESEAALRDFAIYAAASDEGDVDVHRQIVSVILFGSGGRNAGLQLLRTPSAAAAPWQSLWRGIAEYLEADYERAASEISAFLKVRPDCERGWFWRSKARYRLGRDADAVADYAHLLKLNPAHAGGFDEQAARRAIADPANFAQGRLQVEQAMRDRPLLGTAFDPANPLHAWVAWRFQQQVNDRPIVWDSSFRNEHAAAYHVYSSRRKAWCIHVSDVHRSGEKRDQPQTSEELWSCLLFELENVMNRWVDLRLYALAERNEIEERAFVLAITENEWQASLQMRAFHALVYFPWAEEHKLAPQYAGWYEDGLTFADRLSALPADARYPWKVYGAQYHLLRRKAEPPQP